MAVSRHNAFINQEINLEVVIRYDSTGEEVNVFSMDKVEIIDAVSGDILETIQPGDITQLSQGHFRITTDDSWNTIPRTIRDKWYFTPAQGANGAVVVESTIIFAQQSVAGNMITPDDIRNKFLKGIDLTDEFGEQMDDQCIQQFIDVAINTIERELRIDIRKRIVISDPQLGEIYDVAEDPYDYYADDYLKWGWLKLFRKPVISVERLEYVFPTQESPMLDIPPEWVKLKKAHGQVNIIPQAGTISQVVVGRNAGYFLPALTAGLYQNVPSLIHIDYTSGFDTIPADLWNAIGKVTSIEILSIMSDAIAQGISNQSISADGLNLSFSRTAGPNALLFQARIENYNKWLENFYSDGYHYYHGAGLAII